MLHWSIPICWGVCLFLSSLLREQKNDIVPSAALYIDTLNQNLGRQVVGLEDGAAKLLIEYDYPCNRTQFKRILKKKQYWKPALPISVIQLKKY